MKVPTEVTRAVVTAEEAARILEPRDDSVLEEELAPGRFGLVEGPFTSWEREVDTRETDGGIAVEQTVRYRAAMPGFRRLLAPAIRTEAGRLPVGGHPWPWWSPPQRQNARVAELISLVCGLALVAGYGAGVTTQTMTFAVDDFAMSDAAQGNALAAVRIGVLASLGLLVIADRRGRRRLLVFVSYAACLTTATGAAAPNLYLLAGTQTLTRGLVTTASVLLVVVAAEEVGARSRAFAVSLLAVSGGAGAMLAVVLLPLADLAAWSWRLLFLVPLLFLPLCRAVARSLPESRRFLAADATEEDDELRHTPEARRHVRNRLALLAISGFALASFQAPSNQLLNDFLKDERGFDASAISLFRIVVSVPGILGIVIGGRLAEMRGRRGVGALAVAVGTAASIGLYLATGAPMWLFGVVSIIFSAATVPALGVYGPELFPTQLRARANAVITSISVIGSATGLVLAGQLDDRLGGLGPAMALLGVGPLLVVGLVLRFYPETAARELEEINPEDAPLTSQLRDPLG